MLVRFLSSLILKPTRKALSQILRILRSLRSVYIVIVGSEFRISVRNMKFCSNNECIVMGNGPSLLEAMGNSNVNFSNKSKICVNQFGLSEYFTITKPEYYLFLDSAFWENKASEKIKLIIENLYGVFEKDVDWNMKIFLPVQARECNGFSRVVSANSNISISYYNCTPVSHSEPLKHFFYKKNLAMPLPQNVLIAGIFLALNMGFDIIYVLGADHSWHEGLHVDENNELYCYEPHFYDNSEPKRVSFYRDSSQKDKLKLHELFSILNKIFEGYIVLEEYSKSINAKIFNSTEKSFIDAFERKKI